MRPELNTTSAIRQWVQQEIDLRIQQMAGELAQKELQEDLWRAIEQDEDLLLKPSEIVDDTGEAIELEAFRSDLLRMIDEVYAEPWWGIVDRWKGYHMANTDKWYFAYTIDGDTITIVDACHAQNMK